MLTDLLDHRAQDGSRCFGAIPQTVPLQRLRWHLAAIPGLTFGTVVPNDEVDAWMEFTFAGHRFTVHDPYGEYWFFVEDPEAPDLLLRMLMEHCVTLLRDNLA